MQQNIDVGQAIRLLDAAQAVAVDVREADEYALEHIPGAVHLPLGSIERQAHTVLPAKDAHLLVYCRTGRRSAEACELLRRLGYTRVQNLGGLLRWPYELENE